MASIRRTLSPSYNHHHHYSPKTSLSSSPPQSHLRRILKALSFLSPTILPTRKWAPHHHHHHPKRIIRRSSLLLRLLLFFLLGFFLGLSPLSTSPLPPPPPPPPNIPTQTNIAIVTPKDLVSVELETKGRLLDAYDPDPDPNKLLIVVTPTYNRALQAYYLLRLAHTLRLVPAPLLWIVVETGRTTSVETARLLRGTGVMYRHLSCSENGTDVKDRGVHQRNAALVHIERHRLDGIVYFADDDNVYTLQLFENLREIRRFGTWPVAMLAQSKNKATLEGPVCNGKEVTGWHTNEKSRRLRRFHVDMSGFAFNSTILWDPKRWNRPTSKVIRQLDTVKEGFQETTFIEQLVEDESQMECLPYDGSRIMNWHLHLEARHLAYPRWWKVSQNLDVVNSLR